MSDSQEQPWSDDPNAPKIPHSLYFSEKARFVGVSIGSILYGVVVVLFFKCIAALFNPVNRSREAIKWGLVSYTVVMFSFVTVLAGMGLNIEAVSYVDDRKFPGVEDVLPPGPLGYQWFIYSKPLTLVPNFMFLLNNWLADGLLLYRCYVVYSMNLWVIAFPCLMYLGSFVMGIVLISYQISHPYNNLWNTVDVDFGLPYFSISLALNVLLTLMIVIRLILRNRDVRTALGLTGIGGSCKAIITMLVESSALYAVTSLLYVGPWGAGNHAADIFLPCLCQIQVIAPLLIIQRVASKNALARNPVVPGRISEVRSRRMPTSGDALPEEIPMGSIDEYGKSTSELGIRVE